MRPKLRVSSMHYYWKGFSKFEILKLLFNQNSIFYCFFKYLRYFSIELRSRLFWNSFTNSKLWFCQLYCWRNNDKLQYIAGIAIQFYLYLYFCWDQSSVTIKRNKKTFHTEIMMYVKNKMFQNRWELKFCQKF